MSVFYLLRSIQKKISNPWPKPTKLEMKGDMKKVRITNRISATSIIYYFSYFVTGVGISDKQI